MQKGWQAKKRQFSSETEAASSHDHTPQIYIQKRMLASERDGNEGARHGQPRVSDGTKRYLSGTLQVPCCGDVKAGAVEGLLFT